MRALTSRPAMILTSLRLGSSIRGCFHYIWILQLLRQVDPLTIAPLRTTAIDEQDAARYQNHQNGAVLFRGEY